jgi:hypothetical protein
MENDAERLRQQRVMQGSLLVGMSLLFLFTVANAWNIFGIAATMFYGIRLVRQNRKTSNPAH